MYIFKVFCKTNIFMYFQYLTEFFQNDLLYKGVLLV
jgi:hypothetical protein